MGDACLAAGDEWDSVMNYRFRSALLGWLMGCDQGPAAVVVGSRTTTYLQQWFDKLSHCAQLNAPGTDLGRLSPMAFKSMMNLQITDSNRMLSAEKVNFGDDATPCSMKGFSPTPAWRQPCITATVALNMMGCSAVLTILRTAYNHLFPWPDESGGSYLPNEFAGHARKMASIRLSYAPCKIAMSGIS
jgi:hypothetical protein